MTNLSASEQLSQRGSNAAVLPAPDTAELDALRRTLERQKSAFDLAMTASQMGTWRYTIADNICVYDENAQRLYGLTEARFVHDEEGVKAKFHADDMAPMWSRIAAAFDPQGAGRYAVDYRVKQPDGLWRWLSASGIVEFEGEGAAKKPVAIVGASRDLTERKQAEQLQRLLLDELNHRVKNTFAVVQALAAHTLRGARDLPSARAALDKRLTSMAKAHDLLTARSWAGADFKRVVAGALEAFPPERIRMSGDPVEISARHTLTLSMALHELATNAAKYGALSGAEGVVTVEWKVEDGVLHLVWQESGGPPVAEPGRKGFGSRLLERLLARELEGTIALDYAPSGLCCRIDSVL